MKSSESKFAGGVWRIDMLGGLRAERAGQSVTHFQTRQTAVLLAFLAFHPARSHPREELIDLLWPEADLDAGRNRLSQALAWLRTQLEPPGFARGSVLAADRYTIGIVPDSILTDVALFEQATQEAERLPEARQSEALEFAVALYQGELLPGYYEDWIQTERRRLAALFHRGLGRLVALYESRSLWEPAIACARRAVAQAPLEEDAEHTLIRLLAAAGRGAEALQEYRAWERLLEKELGERPSPALQTLAEQTRRGAAVNSPGTSLRSAPGTPSVVSSSLFSAPSLPAPLTRFFGREQEIAQIQRGIQSEHARLVTLTGVGGAGKTRLALEAAAALSPFFQNRVWIIPLADLGDGRHILDHIAGILGISRRAQGSLLQQIADTLARQPALLVIDNLEHLIASGSLIMQELLANVPSLTLLITSRQRLGIEGEREIPVPTLSIPTGLRQPGSEEALPDLLQSESVRMFVDRAQTVRPSFSLTPQNAADVARLCERLEGLPLAIELCAAWAQTLAPAQMLTLLDRRFDLLISRRADISPRHRTLRAALEYSYLLLPSEMQQLFVRLSVFRGGWTLEAAHAVCTGYPPATGSPAGSAMELLAALTELRERSLILAEESVGEDTMRYRMLETLREFAVEQQTLAVERPLRQQHAAYFRLLAEQAASKLASQDQQRWVRILELEHDNLRAALHWMAESGAALEGLRLGVAMLAFWDIRGYLSEGQEWLERLLALSITPDASAQTVRAQALNACALLARARARFAEAGGFASEALELARKLNEPKTIAESLQILGTLAFSREDYVEARRFLEEALELGLRAGDRSVVAGAQINLGNLTMELHLWDEAWSWFSQALEYYRSEGAQRRISVALNNLGLVERYRNNLSAARALIDESVGICRVLEDRPGTAIGLLNAGTIARLEGRFSAAHAGLREAVTLAIEVDNYRALAWCIRELGHLAVAEARGEEAARLLAAAENLRLALRISFHPADPEELTRNLALLRTSLDRSAIDALWQISTDYSVSEANKRAIQVLREQNFL